MKITKSRKDLTAGTMILHRDGYIMLKSDYDDYHGAYSYIDVCIDDDGDVKEMTTGGLVTPADLIGSDI